MIKKILLGCLLSFTTLSASDDFIRIKSHTQDSFLLTATFPQPLERSIKNDKTVPTDTYLSMPGLAVLQEQGYPRVPYLNRMFSLPANQVSYRITNIKTKLISISNYAVNLSKPDIYNQVSGSNIQNKEWIEISNHGLFRDIPIFTLTIFPVRIQQNGRKAEVIESVTIEISTGVSGKISSYMPANYSTKDRSLLKKLFINDQNINYKIAKPLLKTSMQYQRFKSGRYKISVKETGLYNITYTDLINADIPIEQFDTRKLRIMNRGREIPIYFKGGEDGSFDPGDYFEFWGERNEKIFIEKYPDVFNDPYSDINVYWMEISSSSGLRMAEESGALAIANPAQYIVPFAYTETLHFEEDNTFIRFGEVNTDSVGYTMDHWFFDRGVTAVGKKTYPAFLPWPYTKISTRSVFLTAMMRGLSVYSPSNPMDNHQVDIWLNNKIVVGSGSWRDQDKHILSNHEGTGLSQTDIFHGENQFEVEMRQPTPVTDITLLNWFDITYQRRYRAYDNQIRFKKQEIVPDGFLLQFEVDGFTRADIEIYKLGVSKIVSGRKDFITADDEHSSYRMSFQDEVFYPDIEYVALTANKKKKPLVIVTDDPWNQEEGESSLLDVTNSADYLIITHDLFFNNASQLKTYREGFGINVALVKVEDIYDEFNFGIKSPLAIKAFLKYAYQNWDQNHRLLYVNLVGDAFFNTRNENNDFVPTFLFETKYYGAAASDHQYSLISGDDTTPDLVIGRIPVSNNSEFEAYFNKLQAYESPSNIGEWRNHGLFISGNDVSTREQYTNLPAFRAQNQRLINLKAPEGFFTRKLNTIEDTSIPGGDPNFGGTTDLIDYFDDGVALINFLGHGGGGIWADVGLFNSADIDRLNNGARLPFIKSMTCFTGAFESASISGIAEKLIVTPDKGAIGVFAASGVGWLHNDFAVGWTLTEFLLEQGVTVGEAMLFTKIFYLNNNLYVTEESDPAIPSYYNLKHSMVNHYNLLGDPYVTISIPLNSLTIEVDNSIPEVGDTILVSIQAPFLSGNGRIELTNQLHEPIDDSFILINNSQAEVEFIIPQQLENQLAYLKAYASSSSGDLDSRGVANIAINKALLDSVVITPRSPKIGDELYFSAYITSPITIQSVKIKNLRGPTGQYFTIDLTQISDTLWSTTTLFGPYLFSDTVFFDVQMTDTAGVIYLDRRNKLVIEDPRPDIKIVGNSFRFDGTEAVSLTLTLNNDSDSLLSNVDLEYFVDSMGVGALPFKSEQIDLNPGEIRDLIFPIEQSYLVTNKEFFAVVDASFNFEERSETNNFTSVHYSGNLVNIPRDIGTTPDGIQNDTISLGNFTRFFLTAGGISASSVLRYSNPEDVNLVDSELQPGFQYVNFKDQISKSVVNLLFRNPESVQTVDAYLEFSVDTSFYNPDYLRDVSICRFVPNLNRWIAHSSMFNEDKISTTVNNLGTFALFKIQDTKNPVIEITINGRILHKDMLVPGNPSIAFILQDENGIDLTSGLQVFIDSEQLSSEDMNLPDSVQNANAISLIATPVLSAGNHELRVKVTDAFGNLTEKVISFQVAEDFEITVYGNYPNPFEDFTFFSFVINDLVNIIDNLSLKIYTVSGRQIREIKRPQFGDDWIPGYHEIKWDGRDQDGVLVANGVYFAVIKANSGNKEFEKILKVAKLR